MLSYVYSFLFVKFFIHELNSLHKFIGIFISNPLSKAIKPEFFVFLGLFQPLEVMDKYFLSVLFLENPIY